MTTNTSASDKLVDLDNLIKPACITIMRDATDAADSVPLVIQLTRTLITANLVQPQQVLILTTRSRATFTEPTPHVHPTLPRNSMRHLSGCRSVDPHPVFTPTCSQTPTNAMRQLVDLITDSLAKDSATCEPRLVVIECLHALRFAFAVDPSAFVRTLTTLRPNGLAVILAAPIACGIDDDLSSIAYIADNVIDLTDLRTGIAIDIDGLITVSKQNGKWQKNSQSRRYKITETAFKISN